MIKSDAQRERTAAQIEGFRQALAKVDREMTGNWRTNSANMTGLSPAS
jgi:hypothetical protein